MKEYKRQYRQLSDETKAKISNSNRNKPKSEIQKKTNSTVDDPVLENCTE